MATSTYEAWVTEQRPIFSRLPGQEGGYTSNEVADWLTAYFDELLVLTKTKLDDLPRQLNPLTCDVEWLDFLRLFAGFTDDIWNKTWSEAAKRALIDNAYKEIFIWRDKGSEKVISFILDTLGINHSIWTGNSFVVGESELPATLGQPAFIYYITLTLEYLRDSYEFREAERINNYFGGVYCDSAVVYDGFYAGFSVASDPVFD